MHPGGLLPTACLGRGGPESLVCLSPPPAPSGTALAWPLLPPVIAHAACITGGTRRPPGMGLCLEHAFLMSHSTGFLGEGVWTVAPNGRNKNAFGNNCLAIYPKEKSFINPLSLTGEGLRLTILSFRDLQTSKFPAPHRASGHWFRGSLRPGEQLFSSTLACRRTPARPD